MKGGGQGPNFLYYETSMKIYVNMWQNSIKDK